MRRVSQQPVGSDDIGLCMDSSNPTPPNGQVEAEKPISLDAAEEVTPYSNRSTPTPVYFYHQGPFGPVPFCPSPVYTSADVYPAYSYPQVLPSPTQGIARLNCSMGALQAAAIAAQDAENPTVKTEPPSFTESPGN